MRKYRDHDAAMYAALARDAAAGRDPHRGVIDSDRDEARDARRFDRTPTVRISGVVRDADEVPSKEDA